MKQDKAYHETYHELTNELTLKVHSRIWMGPESGHLEMVEVCSFSGGHVFQQFLK